MTLPPTGRAGRGSVLSFLSLGVLRGSGWGGVGVKEVARVSQSTRHILVLRGGGNLPLPLWKCPDAFQCNGGGQGGGRGECHQPELGDFR